MPIPAEPLISVITPSLNQREFIEDCICSILHQTFKNWEHIVVDGKSTDNTLEILKKYPHLRWISEKDFGYWDAVTKGVKMAKGKYIMVCMASDGYIRRDWLKLCAEILEQDDDVSLVWGFSRWLEDDKLTDTTFPHFHHSKVPQKFDWYRYWLMTGESFPIGNLCIHKKIFQICNPYPKNKIDGRELLALYYNFNMKGYLPYNIPFAAEFGRAHVGQLSEQWAVSGKYAAAEKWGKVMMNKEWNQLKRGEKKHVFRDRHNVSIKKDFDISRFNRLLSLLLTFRIYFFFLLQRVPTKIKMKIQKMLIFK